MGDGVVRRAQYTVSILGVRALKGVALRLSFARVAELVFLSLHKLKRNLVGFLRVNEDQIPLSQVSLMTLTP